MAGLAGCGSVSDYRFSARPVVVPPAARAELGLEPELRESMVAERSGEVGGADVDVTVESRMAVYESVAGEPPETDGPGVDPVAGPTADRPTVGVVSTPRATVLGRSFNPLARLSLSTLLASEAGEAVLRRADLDEVGAPRRTVRWERGPALVAERPGSCLGESTTIGSYAGLLAGDPATAAFVHVLRVAADDVVLAVAVHGRTVSAPDGPFVGADGYLPAATVAAAADRLARVSAALGYGEA